MAKDYQSHQTQPGQSVATNSIHSSAEDFGILQSKHVEGPSKRRPNRDSLINIQVQKESCIKVCIKEQIYTLYHPAQQQGHQE